MFWNPYAFDNIHIGNATITHVMRMNGEMWRFMFNDKGVEYYCLCVVYDDGYYNMDWLRVGGNGRGQILDATQKQIDRLVSEKDMPYFESFVNWIIRTYN